MYTKEEYERRIKELGPVAKEIVEKKTPDEARDIVSRMSPEDAYIMGMWIGKTIALDELGRTLSEMAAKKEKQEVPIVLSLN